MLNWWFKRRLFIIYKRPYIIFPYPRYNTRDNPNPNPGSKSTYDSNVVFWCNWPQNSAIQTLCGG